ncbi:MAG: hypothetical protein O2913_06425 [Chloroflexi bacterium]|nr:hypothetical protein [Chloroflexota bacterium]
MGLRWYVARTEPRSEFIAAEELARDGYDVFFPRLTDPKQPSGRTKAPLFPGYLFLRCDREAGGWPSFRNAHRIAGWVRFGGEVPSLPDRDILELRKSLESINQKAGMPPKFSPGEKVHVAAGNLQGLAEIIEGAKTPRARVKVLMQFMGRMVKAQVPWQSVEAVADRPVGKPQLPRRTRGKGRWTREFRPAAGVTR